MAEGLVQQGVDVTLFATGDSCTDGQLVSLCPRGYEEDPEADPKVLEILHIAHLMQQADKFDLIHNNFDFMPLAFTPLIKTPVVTTIHGFSSNKIVPVYQRFAPFNHYVSISYSDRCPDLPYLANVYNGLKVENFDFQKTPKDYLLFFGRIHPDKGTFESIQIAHRSQRKLIISGLIQDEVYFREKVEPWVDGEKVVYVGNSGPEKRNELLGNAWALLHPIRFDEPFGLSVVESMLCGTPVIAFDRGSMPEVIKSDQTGFLVPDVAEAVQVVDRVDKLNRSQCREWAVANFSQEKMIRDYLEVYSKVLSI